MASIPEPPPERPRSAHTHRMRLYTPTAAGTTANNGTNATQNNDSGESPALSQSASFGSMRTLFSLSTRAGSQPSSSSSVVASSITGGEPDSAPAVSSAASPPRPPRINKSIALSKMLRRSSTERCNGNAPQELDITPDVDLDSRRKLMESQQRPPSPIRRNSRIADSAPPPRSGGGSGALLFGASSSSSASAASGTATVATNNTLSGRPSTRQRPPSQALDLFGPAFSRIVHAARELGTTRKKEDTRNGSGVGVSSSSAQSSGNGSSAVNFSCLFVSANEMLEFGDNDAGGIPVVDWGETPGAEETDVKALVVPLGAARPPLPPPHQANQAPPPVFSAASTGRLPLGGFTIQPKPSSHRVHPGGAKQGSLRRALSTNNKAPIGQFPFFGK